MAILLTPDPNLLPAIHLRAFSQTAQVCLMKKLFEHLTLVAKETSLLGDVHTFGFPWLQPPFYVIFWVLYFWS